VRSLATMETRIAAHIAAVTVAALLLFWPAVWNGFPLLFYDTGAYLGRAFFDSLSPGRSAVYGFFLGAGHWLNFWPIVLAQSVVTVWVVALLFRAHDLDDRPALLAVVFAILAITTGLPWLTGQLMPDVFAGLAALALYLVVFRDDALAGWERNGLIVLIAFAAATHNATFAVVLILLLAAVAARFSWPRLLPAIGLARIAGALALGVAMLLSANFAVTGRLAWTPGGTAFIFSRLVQDGIVHRFLEDNCPNPRYELCKYRAALPHHANDFLWHQGADGPFVLIGSFDKGADEMREIALASLWQYPGLHLRTAVRSTLEQLVAVGTGWGIVHDVWDAYGHIEHLTPKAVPAAHSAKQRHRQLDFEPINKLHVPVALASMAVLALFLAASWRRRQSTPLAQLAAAVGAALLANAFVCGALSNPHDRYGSRIAWIAVLFVAVAVARFLAAYRIVPPVQPEPMAPEDSIAAAPPQPGPSEIPATTRIPKRN
jgi:hypothetical protein